MYYAVGGRHSRVVELLIERGMDVNEPNSRGRTVLQAVTRSMNLNKERICRVTEMRIQDCTDLYVRNPTITSFQEQVWGYKIDEWIRDYIISYDMVELLKSKGAEEVELEP